jgi:DMSO/TMAO reductase YedYZ molybdopterin-dependent catalytic subunit
LQRRFSNAAERAAVQVRAPAEPLQVTAADPATQIPGLSPLFVPNKDFYRIDTALIAPTVSTDGWQLAIDGMVDNPLSFTYDDLWKRTLVEYDVTLSCVSNEVGGDLVGNARWLGVRLDELLAEAKVRPDADQIMGHSVDGFTAGFPTDTLADGRNAIVALAMNGEVLPVAHGYPARLVVPGLYGYVSATKWLSRIELTRFDRAQGYWIPRGWSERAPIKTQSRIDTPRRGAKVDGTVAVAGVAWAPTRGITRVEVQVDDGPWQPANLGPEVSASSWRQWWWEWTTPPVGEHRLRCRATDGSGATQTEQRSRPDPDGATGWHTIDVEVR